ncbi:MAG: methyl-accepting chemotaxis protein [Vicinamibacterales bacterium]
MQNWTLGKRLAIGFGAVVIVVLAVGSYAIVELNAVRAAAMRIVNDSLPGTALSGEVAAAAKDNHLALLEMLDAPDAAAVARHRATMQATSQTIGSSLEKYASTITQPDDRAIFDAIAKVRADYLAERDQVIALFEAGKAAQARERFAAGLAPFYVAYMEQLDALSDWNIAAGSEVGAWLDSTVSFAVFSVALGLLGAVVVAAVVAGVTMRSTSRVLSVAVNSLREGSEQVVSAAGQVATSAQSLSAGATEQAASLEETSASMEEMASMTRRNAESSRDAAGLMREVDDRVRKSNDALQLMSDSMTSIQESSHKVSQIIKTIDEIAFQTNILALNAAVEAARAGEAGMGFAVVADEVRNLAQRSAQAAKDTAALIDESARRAQTGAESVQQVVGAIGGITETVDRAKGLVETVSEASQQQSQGIDQVSQAIAQMERVTQTTAATAEESAAASEELNAQAETSMQVVRGLEALIGGAAAARAGAPAARKTARLTLVSAPPKAPVIPLDDEPQATGTFGAF